ncbi:MAG: MBL fold metallo-hydrolase [Clostridium sp.]|nr:MBL fold metallo-hydrolase [Clostridium sp.]
MTRISYLENSGFAVVTDDAILVFDDFRDPSNKLHHLLDNNPDKKVVFFISHRHPDHYNHAIFEMAQNHDRTYVVSNDVPARDIPSTLRVAGMSPGDVVEDIPGCRSVKAFGSTDAGVSFLVTLSDGQTIFHAGDLNNWHWKDRSSEREVRKAENDFHKVLNRIVEEAPQIDIAMFPVEPRMGIDFAIGAQEFLHAVKVGDFFPMHFGADWEVVEDFISNERNVEKDTRFHLIHTPGKTVTIG